MSGEVVWGVGGGAGVVVVCGGEGEVPGNR